jgi:hypothetical protein
MPGRILPCLFLLLSLALIATTAWFLCFKAKPTAMQDFKQLELSALYEMLAENTTKFTQMLTNGAPEGEFETCKETIVHLQTEIASRRGTKINEIS